MLYYIVFFLLLDDINKLTENNKDLVGGFSTLAVELVSAAAGGEPRRREDDVCEPVVGDAGLRRGMELGQLHEHVLVGARAGADLVHLLLRLRRLAGAAILLGRGVGHGGRRGQLRGGGGGRGRRGVLLAGAAGEGVAVGGSGVVVVGGEGDDEHAWVGPASLHLLPRRASLGAATSVVPPARIRHEKKTPTLTSSNHYMEGLKSREEGQRKRADLG